MFLKIEQAMIQTFLTEAKTTRILLFVDQMDEFEWNYNALSCTKKTY